MNPGRLAQLTHGTRFEAHAHYRAAPRTYADERPSPRQLVYGCGGICDHSRMVGIWGNDAWPHRYPGSALGCHSHVQKHIPVERWLIREVDMSEASVLGDARQWADLVDRFATAHTDVKLHNASDYPPSDPDGFAFLDGFCACLLQHILCHGDPVLRCGYQYTYVAFHNALVIEAELTSRQAGLEDDAENRENDGPEHRPFVGDDCHGGDGENRLTTCDERVGDLCGGGQQYGHRKAYGCPDEGEDIQPVGRLLLTEGSLGIRECPTLSRTSLSSNLFDWSPSTASAAVSALGKTPSTLFLGTNVVMASPYSSLTMDGTFRLPTLVVASRILPSFWSNRGMRGKTLEKSSTIMGNKRKGPDNKQYLNDARPVVGPDESELLFSHQARNDDQEPLEPHADVD